MLLSHRKQVVEHRSQMLSKMHSLTNNSTANKLIRHSTLLPAFHFGANLYSLLNASPPNLFVYFRLCGNPISNVSQQGELDLGNTLPMSH